MKKDLKRIIAVVLLAAMIVPGHAFGLMPQGEVFGAERRASEPGTAGAAGMIAEQSASEPGTAGAAGRIVEQNDPASSATGAAGTTSTIDRIAEQISDPDNIPFRYTTNAVRRRAMRLASDAGYPAKFDLTGKFMEDGGVRVRHRRFCSDRDRDIRGRGWACAGERGRGISI